jgi:hypothetical protein
MKSIRLFIMSSIIVISVVAVAFGGGGGYGTGGYKGTYPSGGYKDSNPSGSYKSDGGAKFNKDTPSYSTTLGQELIDLEAAYKKGIITEEQYNRFKNALIEQRTGKGK